MNATAVVCGSIRVRVEFSNTTTTLTENTFYLGPLTTVCNAAISPVCQNTLSSKNDCYKI